MDAVSGFFDRVFVWNRSMFGRFLFLEDLVIAPIPVEHQLEKNDAKRQEIERLEQKLDHPPSRLTTPRPPQNNRKFSIATPGACYRGPKPQKCPKWLGEGAKGVLDLGSKGLPRVSCTTKTLFCTGATLFCTSARGHWRSGPKRPFAPSPNHFGHF